jgi:hypothetical protein
VGSRLLELCRAFLEQGSEFAYPTRTLFVARENGDQLTDMD